MAVIRKTSELVAPTRVIEEIEKDEPDNRFLECAVAAGADYLITGNTKHFPQAFENIRIVTPKQFLEFIVALLAQEGSD